MAAQRRSQDGGVGRDAVPAPWHAWLETWLLYRELSDRERSELWSRMLALDARWTWEGCGGFEITSQVRTIVVAQAALLVLRLDYEFRNVPAVLIYPSAFRNPLPAESEVGVVSVGEDNEGEAWADGPVILSWDEVYEGYRAGDDGRNLVFHEFAHKIDLADGSANGRPPLGLQVDRPPWLEERWRDILSAHYEALGRYPPEDPEPLLDPYGAEDPAEFFSVVTECFFEQGPELRAEHPDLYRAFAAFYGQDPAGRARFEAEPRPGAVE